MSIKALSVKDPFNSQDLAPTPYIDFTHKDIQAFYKKHSRENIRDTAISLYFAVRDGIRYDPYSIDFSLDGMKASSTLARGYGYCVVKAILLVALARAAGIPARLGFADVRNHLTTKRLYELMGSDLFVYHGYAALYLDGKWLKTSPTFNKELCERFSILPLDFDGKSDALLHPFDAEGKKHMSYEKDHGLFQDLPVKDLVEASFKAYPRMMEHLTKGVKGDFYKEAEKI